MGCFSGGKQPSYNPPPAPKLKTPEELYNEAIGFAKTNMPQAYGARESALSDLAMGTDYYKGFSPTSFEQALGDQYFANVWPDTERQIKHALSLSGIESSPILAQQLGKARGQVGYDIGSYLSNLGNQRAQQSLTSRLSIDPYTTFGPYQSNAQNQYNAQAQYDYQAALERAQADYQEAMNKYKQKSGLLGLGATGLGAGLGALLALPTGGLSVGAGALFGGLGGSALAPAIGGTSPISMQDSISLASMGLGGASPIPATPGVGGYPAGTPQWVFDFGNFSSLPSQANNVQRVFPQVNPVNYLSRSAPMAGNTGRYEDFLAHLKTTF